MPQDLSLISAEKEDRKNRVPSCLHRGNAADKVDGATASCPWSLHEVLLAIVQYADCASSSTWLQSDRTAGTVKPSMRTFDEGLDALGASSRVTPRSWLMPDAPRRSLLMLLLLCLPCRTTQPGFEATLRRVGLYGQGTAWSHQSHGANQHAHHSLY